MLSTIHGRRVRAAAPKRNYARHVRTAAIQRASWGVQPSSWVERDEDAGKSIRLERTGNVTRLCRTARLYFAKRARRTAKCPLSAPKPHIPLPFQSPAA